MKLLIKITITLICLVALGSKNTGSYYSDTEESVDNCFILTIEE